MQYFQMLCKKLKIPQKQWNRNFPQPNKNSVYVFRCIYGGGKKTRGQKIRKNRYRLGWGRGEEGGLEWDGAPGPV